MKAAGRFLYHPIQYPMQCSWYCISRFAWAGLMMIALVVGDWFPLIVAAPHHGEEKCPAVAIAPMPTRATTSAERFAGDALARLPLRFEACDKRAPAQFLARTNESTVYLSATEATLALRATAGAGRLGRVADLGLPRNARSPQANEQLPEPRRDRAAPRRPAAATIRMQLIGANHRARVVGENQLATRTNYFIGTDASGWQTGVANYERVKVEQVYRGIDIVYYGSGQQLEYDFKVAPGADFKAIRLRFAGAGRVRPQSVRLDEAGDLLIETPAATLRHLKPVAYQQVNGVHKDIAARYVIKRRRGVGVAVGDYDKRLPLVIDPVLSAATYFGSRSGMDSVEAVAFDAAGNSYLAGSTSSPDLPTTPGAFQPVNHSTDVFVAKLNPTGTAALYVTYLGGSSYENGASIAVDGKGNAYVAGTTGSTDFPTTANAFQSQSPGFYSHPFVAKLNATGTALVYATYVGSPDESATCVGIAIDAAGHATIAGFGDSRRFPTTPDALQPAPGGGYDALIARLSADGSALVFATYLGGADFECVSGLALDPAGNVYVAGRTVSTNFPTTRHAYQRQNKRGDDNFVAKISPTGNRLVYSTLLGGDFKLVNAIAVDLGGDAYVTGHTLLPNLPTTAGALQATLAGGVDAFVIRLNNTGSALVYSTFLGGSGNDAGTAIAVDSLGQAHVTGRTTSADFPLVNPLQSRKFGGPLFKSTDSGSLWDDVPALSFEINSLVVDPQVTSMLYASTRGDIIKSTDGGATWHVIASGVSGSLVIDPVRSGVLYAFNLQTIYKSTDSGATWQRVDLQIDNSHGISALVIDPKAPDTVYLSAALFAVPGSSDAHAVDALTDVMFKSTDGGTSWRTLSLGLPVSSVECLAIDPRMTSTVYAGTFTHGLLKSTDGGASWFMSSFLISRLVVDPTNTATLYGAGFLGVLKSTNGGTSWNQTAQQRVGVSSLAIDSQTPSTLYAGGFDGLHQTTDGGANWRVSLDRIFVKSITLDSKQPSTVYVSANATNDAFVAKLNATGTALVYSTYLGGTLEDSPASIAVDAYGNAFIAGITYSADFPVIPNAYQTRGAKSFTGFLIRIADPAPLRIAGVSIKGKKLFVSGEGFDPGAVITVNNIDLETQNDSVTPSVLLISKRGGKQIAPGQTVTIRVRNADGRLSDEFIFVRPVE